FQAIAAAGQELAQQRGANLAEIAGDNEIVIVRPALQVFKMPDERGRRRRSHGRPEAVSVLFPHVDDLAYGCRGDARALPGGADHRRRRPGDSPLGLPGALEAVLRGIAVLALGAAIMA